MISTYDVIGLPEGLAIGFCVFTFIIALSPYFPGLDFGILKIPRIPLNNHRQFKIFAVLPLVIAVLFFMRVWPTNPEVDVALKPGQIEKTGPLPPIVVEPKREEILADNSKIAFYPIPDLPERINTFAVPTMPEPTISLWFTSLHWGIVIPFRVSQAMTVGDLKKALLNHFQLAERIFVSSSGAINVAHDIEWILSANGRKISDQEQEDRNTNTQTLAQMNLTDGNVLGFLVAHSFYGRVEYLADLHSDIFSYLPATGSSEITEVGAIEFILERRQEAKVAQLAEKKSENPSAPKADEEKVVLEMQKVELEKDKAEIAEEKAEIAKTKDEMREVKASAKALPAQPKETPQSAEEKTIADKKMELQQKESNLVEKEAGFAAEEQKLEEQKANLEGKKAELAKEDASVTSEEADMKQVSAATDEEKQEAKKVVEASHEKAKVAEEKAAVAKEKVELKKLKAEAAAGRRKER